MKSILSTILITISCFLVVCIVVPIVKKMAIHINALDIPDKRKVHKSPTARLGGIAIFIGFLFGYMFFLKQSRVLDAVLIGSFLLVLTGLIDDIKPLKAKYQFIMQLIASLILVFYGDLVLETVNIFNTSINFGIFSYPITIFLILSCINCMNFIDGLDGLAAGISSIYFTTTGVISICLAAGTFDYTLCFIMLGCCLGFLTYNFYPAKIFMGNDGSMLIGYIISVITLHGFKNVTLTSFFIPFMILAIPFLDTLFAILRRYFKGEEITKPDKFHVHHQLLNLNLSHKMTVIIIWLIDALFALASAICVLVDATLGYIIYVILLILVIIFILKTNIIFDFKKTI